MKKETARTRRIYGETQHVATKMNKLLHHERPRRRMESVTPRGLHVTCHFRLDQRENLTVDQSQEISSKLVARGEIGTHNHTVTATNQYTRTETHLEHNEERTAHTRIRRETQDVARKMNKLLRHERPRWRMESVTPRRLDVTCHFRLDQRENLPVDQCQEISSKPAAPSSKLTLKTTRQLQPINEHKHTQHNEERSRPHTHL